MIELYQIDSYYCAGLVVQDGIVCQAAPILRWTEGLKIEFVMEYCKSKKLVITLISGN